MKHKNKKGRAEPKTTYYWDRNKQEWVETALKTKEQMAAPKLLAILAAITRKIKSPLAPPKLLPTLAATTRKIKRPLAPPKLLPTLIAITRKIKSLIALPKLLPALAAITRKIKSPKPSWKLTATIASAIIVIVTLALAGLLIPGSDGDDVPDSGDSSHISGLVVPTNTWMNFYGLESTLDGQPLPLGAVITACDPQGIVCGEFSVTQAGRYGLMPVYGDDPLTEVDEGAVPGDTLEFGINGIPVTVTGPDEPVWTAMGDLKQANLAEPTTD